ncbi:MAG TPA: aminopeptidase P family N-terminal domain-containing protein [Acidimicrobiia bacterium]|nr:aminopeptidase P family N-terminal domain-containing protein [Acidimicrobiia bacterium]
MTSSAEHRDRLRAAMADEGIDVLVLGREANARYVADANRLWLAGTRPFAPGCVLVGATGAVGLLNVTDDGVPADVPRTALYPISWNPMNLVSGAAAVAAGTKVRRIGVDSMSPLFAQLLTAGFPDAELADGEALLRRVRRTKSDADLASIRAAVEVAEEALDAAIGGSGDGTARAARAEERRAALGVTTPAFPAIVDVRDGAISARVGVIREGWLGVLARTRPDGGAARDAADAAAGRCRPGTLVGAVRAEGASVDGVGLGHEALRDDDALAPGMVVYVEALRDGARWGDPLLVTDQGGERLTA